ncbi:uncharacterized protein LOC125806060 [Astyanax mexicanus]|uniref:uncharacterized protein LOC125806060 n=1 Tax=Astyanax mexicanus TaxID=7994 RepID=UPI0020CAAEB6|nr:uncharacterized protein LOC125806060 [Astyanax mexicanus]
MSEENNMLHRENVEGDAAIEQLQGAAAPEPLIDCQQANNRQEPFQTPDTRSRISKRSSESTSTAAARARAKAKAAQAQLVFAEKEASLMRKKAALCGELEASLHVLKIQRDAAAAEAEAAAYEEEQEIESEERSYKPYVPGNPLSAFERANNYVQQHSAFFGRQPSPPPVNMPLHSFSVPSYPAPLHRPTVIKKEEKSDPSPVKHYLMPPHQPPRVFQEPQQAQDLARYLMRREIVSSGLLQFDDRPEHYRSWKASFLSATQDLNLSSREELDLLVKWLGTDSAEQARRLRSVHVLDPAAGLRMVWQRMEDCYGTPEAMEHALLKKIEEFPRLTNKDNVKLRELGDLLLELECAKDEGYLPGLAFLDTARGVNPIAEKLPHSLQEKWITMGSKYKTDHGVAFPPFSLFSQFIRQQAKVRNDPSFAFTPSSFTSQNPEKFVKPKYRASVSVHKTDVTPKSTDSNSSTAEKKMSEPDRECPIHRKPHPLKKCRVFRIKPIEERRAYLKDNRICYKCCGSTQHMAKDCKVPIKCAECNSERHIAALHPGPPTPKDGAVTEKEESGELDEDMPTVTASCTEVCGNSDIPRSCAKICPIRVYPAGKKEKAVKIYAVLDEQSNKSLAKKGFFKLFDVKASSAPYTLKTCAGTMHTSGRRVSNFMLESLDGKLQLPLPTLIECDMIPDDRAEIPYPEVAQHHPHLQSVANKIPPVDPDAPILILLGRDILQVHKVREQINGPHNSPYAQRLDLGWVIVGEACLGAVHKPVEVNVYKANVLQNGRTSFLCPCPNNIQVKEGYSGTPQHHHAFFPHQDEANLVKRTDDLGHSLFESSKDDNKPALSIDDRAFLTIMEKEVYQDTDHSWVAPLPFRASRQSLPSNREQAVKRLSSLKKTLEKKQETKRHYAEFVQKMLDNDQAEHAPPLEPGKEHWYLPTFGVYHPKKPDQIRVVFDSSATCDGVSLNDVLLSGPDLNNTLLGVLLRFRKEPVAVTADVQQMFYCFVVRKDHRDYLRFLWYEDSDFAKNIVEYRMKVHVFGNTPSPAIAIYCMRRAAKKGEAEYGSDARQFVERQFYVDDALTSVTSPEQAIDLLTRTREMLAESNLLLHKIASNSEQVMEAFPEDDRSKDLKDLDLGSDPLPLQRSLGLSWNLETDSFTFQVSREVKPYTRRGILSTVNSLYDPLGFIAPVILQGKALVRELSTEQGWDTPLNSEKEPKWKMWRESLNALEDLQIKRCYIPMPLSSTQRKELCIFCDASTTAIGAVAYLRTIDANGNPHVGFVMGKSKLAPRPAHTIPRLELCAAVLAVQMYELIRDEMDMHVDTVRFFTDSKIVLGYIHNSSRRFYVYVSNRVTRIRRSTNPDQWTYIHTDHNSADHATRFMLAEQLQQSSWLSGPSFLSRNNPEEIPKPHTFTLVEPDTDAEVRPEVTALATRAMDAQLGSKRFERFSQWKNLCNTTAKLIHVAAAFKGSPASSKHKGWNCFIDRLSISELSQAKSVIIRAVQQDAFEVELECLKEGKTLPKHSPLKKLNPVADKDNLLRVGGRLSSAPDLSREEKHPLIIPRTHHIATLLVRHYHEQIVHQGRHITEGAVRAAGYWIIGGKRLVSSVIHKCVTCRKLRGRLQEQKMADLPTDRLTPEPPFTHVGLDVFGPWAIMTRRTRGGSADSKRWAVIFTCMATRAVHLELLESMTTDSFINALRRFFAVRGPARLLRSDRGTNFVGACKELGINMEDSTITAYLQSKGCSWVFNPPHASHMGGAWERLIGIARRILDAMLLQTGHTRLTHEVLSTLMAEVMAIINARPLVAVSSDPDMPTVLTPALLLTQKISTVSAPSGNFQMAELHGKQWKHVQCLANTFWKRWRRDYLSTLQGRRKWTDDQPNVKPGDVVLLKDSQAHRNEWPVGVIVNTLPSSDKRIRKVEVKIVKDGTVRVLLRPISELVVLLSE